MFAVITARVFTLTFRALALRSDSKRALRLYGSQFTLLTQLTL